MSILYWVFEYGKVFYGYLSLMFLWPSVVFWKHLKRKSLTYRFGFCVTVPVVISNIVVLTLGLFHILYQWIVWMFFCGVFVFALCKNILNCISEKYKEESLEKFPDMNTLRDRYQLTVRIVVYFIVYFTYTRKAIVYLIRAQREKNQNVNIKRIFKGVVRYLAQGGFLVLQKYGLLVVVLVYGMSYFSYGAFQVHSYGYGDLYVHHEWIQGLIEGKIFVGGIYPEAMHCFIYCMNLLYGVRVYSILLFLQGIHVAVFLVSAYLLLRCVFHCKYTPVFVLMLFLTLQLDNADLIHSMFRMQITMPMEFGLHTVCLCTLYLARYLKKEHAVSKYYWDENVFIFTIALSTSAMTHFHVLIMVIIFCFAFAIFEMKKIICRKYLIPVVMAVLCAGLIALIPMAGAMMQGIPLNDSISWAVKAMDGRESRKFRDQLYELVVDESDDLERQESNGGSNIAMNLPRIYSEGYVALYGAVKGRWIFLLTIVVVEFCLWSRKKTIPNYVGEICSRYPAVILASFLYILVYVSPMIGLPDIVPEGRFYAPGHMMILAVMVMPADILFSELARYWNTFIMRVLSYLSVVWIYSGSIFLGSFRGYLFYELTRYNAAVEVTNTIIDTYPQYSYTIVSPTDELYQVIQYGRHEELLAFVNNCNTEEYTIPTEHIFIYVEKKPILYAQSYFFEGSLWMGEKKYLSSYWESFSLKFPDNGACQSPNLITAQISQEMAETSMPEYDNAWMMYSNLDNRTILESKAYDWCSRFLEKYPAVIDVYYEDDDFICYHIRQDMNEELYSLGIK